MATVIGIFSAKGGVGKTILATNLAVAFGIGHRQKTLLIDLNQGSGTADMLLDLEPERSWSDLVSVFDELTSQHVKLAVTEYRPGVDLLAASPEITWKETLSKKNITSLLDVVQEEYDLILLDTDCANGGVTGVVLSVADIRLVTLTPDAPCLRATTRFLETLKDKEKDKNLDKRTGLVINQYSPGAAVKPDEISEHLGERLFGVLPIDPGGVWANISYGEPCVLRKTSKLGKSIRALAGLLFKIIEQKKILRTYRWEKWTRPH